MKIVQTSIDNIKKHRTDYLKSNRLFELTTIFSRVVH